MYLHSVYKYFDVSADNSLQNEWIRDKAFLSYEP